MKLSVSMCELFSCMCAKEHACRVAVRVLSTKLTFIASAGRGGLAQAHSAAPCTQRGHQARPPSAEQSAAVRRSQHRRQDGQRAAAGARAARLGADARPPAEATLGPALFPAPPRGARRRCQARHHIPESEGHPE